MAHAKEDIDGNNGIEVDNVDEDSDVDAEVLVDSTDDDDEKIRNFIEKIVSAGYDKDLAVQALKFIDPEDVPAGKCLII